jgi:hypothetical protein
VAAVVLVIGGPLVRTPQSATRSILAASMPRKRENRNHRPCQLVLGRRRP